MDAEVRYPVLADGMIKNFWKLGDRIICIDDFLRDFPHFAKASELKQRVDLYVDAFTQGTDNSKPKDHFHEALAAYCHFLTRCTPHQKQVQQAHYSLIKAPIFSKKQASEDLIFACQLIDDNHVCAVNGFPSELKQRLERQIDSFPPRLSLCEIWAAALKIVSGVDGHTDVRPPSFFDPQEFNVNLIFEDRRPYIIVDGKKYAVAEINNACDPLGHIADEFFAAENDYGRFHRASYLITHPMYRCMLGLSKVDELKIKYRDGNELKTIIAQPTVNKEAVPRPKFIDFKIDKQHHFAVLTLLQCNYNSEYKQTLKKFFEEVKLYKIRRIVVDLRENCGGDSRVCAEFLQYLPCKSYLDVKGIVRKGGQLQPFNPGRKPNKVHDKLAFHGEVFVWTSPRTFSSATMLAILIKDNGLGKIIGVPSGNAPNAFGDRVDCTLPNSKLYFVTTFKKFFRPDGFNNEDALSIDDVADEIYERAEQLTTSAKGVE
ncbi:MAG: hypothetical protein LBR89_01090 [Holosporales bacterium]|jgi:hypothetical protein|nr:hypothetical protein [Holosporales bacterium]